jgi:hypothetical protein
MREKMNLKKLIRKVEQYTERVKNLDRYYSSGRLVMHPDCCLFINRYFKLFHYRRLVKRGETKGFTLFQVGWLTASVRW